MEKRRKKYLITIIVLLALILIGGFLFARVMGPGGSNSKFRTVKVERGEISSIVTAT